MPATPPPHPSDPSRPRWLAMAVVLLAALGLSSLMPQAPPTLNLEGPVVDLHWHIAPLQKAVSAERATENLAEHASAGKPLFVNLWATWCPPCVKEMPAIQGLYDRFGDKVRFAVIALEEEDVVREFVQRAGYTMPIYTTDVMPPEALSTDAIPVTLLISPEGRILFRHVGWADWSDEDHTALLEQLART